MPIFALALLLATSTITATKTSNGTTLPFQHHIVRAGPAVAGQGTLAAVVTKQGVDGEGLVMFRSLDDGRTWQREAAIQPDPTERSTADLLADPGGGGFSLVYGLEPKSSVFVADPRSDVVFLHETLGPTRHFAADVGPVVVFHPGTGEGFYRPSVTRDTAGVLHCSATRRDAAGNFAYLVRTSTDGGRTWNAAETLATFGTTFGGGCVVAFGNRVGAIFDSYAVGTTGRLRTRPAGAQAGAWGAVQAFASDGLYHAGAFSVTATPDAHLHLGYSIKSSQALRYREFDGTTWSAPITMEPVGWWANQPALSHQGQRVTFAWNHMDPGNVQRIFVRIRDGATFGPAQLVDGVVQFHGYTGAIDEVFPGESLQIIWSQEDEVAHTVPVIRDAQVALGPVPPPPPPPPPPGASFSDNFDACTSAVDLGAAWSISGRWYCAAGRARGESAAGLATTRAFSGGDTTVEARLQPTGTTGGGGVAARISGGAFYAARWFVDGTLTVVRVDAAGEAILGTTRVTADPTLFHRLTLRVTGTNPVQLDLAFDRVAALSAVDASASRLGGAGAAGLVTRVADRTQFDDFVAHSP